MAHEILVDLFKTRPELAAEILVEALGLALPVYTEARLGSVDLTQAQPAEYRADLVVLLYDGDALVRVLIVEIQLAIDPRKRLSLPVYVTASRAIHGCPASLLVRGRPPARARDALRDGARRGRPGRCHRRCAAACRRPARSAAS